MARLVGGVLLRLEDEERPASVKGFIGNVLDIVSNQLLVLSVVDTFFRSVFEESGLKRF